MKIFFILFILILTTLHLNANSSTLEQQCNEEDTNACFKAGVIFQMGKRGTRLPKSKGVI